MKSLPSWLFALTFASLVHGASAGTYVPVASENLFVPRGFDDNDDIVVTVAGNFPNTCYQLAHAELKTDGTSNRIQVQQMAYVVPGPCSRVLVPFSNTVHLGRLPAGNYVVLTKDAGLRSALPVSRAPVPTQDDYLYAPITAATFIPSLSGGSVYLEGRRTNSCMRLRDIAITYTGATIQVMPIIALDKRQPDGSPCRNIDEPLRLTKKLARLSRGRYLLHVRSLNGRSVDVVINVD